MFRRRRGSHHRLRRRGDAPRGPPPPLAAAPAAAPGRRPPPAAAPAAAAGLALVRVGGVCERGDGRVGAIAAGQASGVRPGPLLNLGLTDAAAAVSLPPLPVRPPSQCSDALPPSPSLSPCPTNLPCCRVALTVATGVRHERARTGPGRTDQRQRVRCHRTHPRQQVHATHTTAHPRNSGPPPLYPTALLSRCLLRPPLIWPPPDVRYPAHLSLCAARRS